MGETRFSTSGTWVDINTEWTATAIADAVKSGRLHPRRAVEESLARIAARDPQLGAFVNVRADAARSEADALANADDLSTMPLAGVPIAIKDNVAVAGEVMRWGSAGLPNEAQPSDHPVVARLRAAGAIIVGTTTVPELSLYAVTDSVFGVTRNPWNPARTAGGSSGGAGAALAAGMVPLAHGNDGLGSVRIPAAACGLVGIKPGSGVVPAQLGTTDWYGMAENGPLATTVADAALGLAVMAANPALASPQLPGNRLVVATSTKSPLTGVRPDSDYIRAVNSVATLLARAGHEISEADPDYTTGEALTAIVRWMVVASDEVKALGSSSHLEPRVRTQARIGRLVRRTPALDSRMANSFIEHATQFLSAYDVVITPALAKPPVMAKEWSKKSFVRTMLGTVAWTPYAAPWNVAGFPAIVVPVGKQHARTKTPLAVQIVARPGREDLLLAIAAYLESVRPWHRNAPPYRE